VLTRHAACNSPGNSTFSASVDEEFPSTPRGSVGKAGCKERFEVEEPFPACQPKCPGLHGPEFLEIGENFRVIFPAKMDHLLQRTEVPSPRLCRAMGHQERLEPSRYTRTEE